MNLFQGQRIRCRGEEWQIIRANSYQIANGSAIWEVMARGLTGIARGMDFCFLSDLDHIEVIDPSQVTPVLDSSPGGRRARLYWESYLRRLLPRNGALYLGQHGAFKPYEYQLKPAAQALHLMRPRILIGDAVGLGKTIECGILLAELMRRGKANRVLCAVPKAVLEQFQNELWGRFSIPFHRLDSKGLERLKQDLPSTMNPFFHFDKVIISIDTLKQKQYQKQLQDCQWDVLIVDECHNVADRTDGGGGSARHRVTRRLAETANAVILMSATPHDGTRHGFASLIKLLDRTRINDDTAYDRSDFEEHFIRRTRTKVAAELEQRGLRKQSTIKIPLTPPETDLLAMIHDGAEQNKLLTKPSNRGRSELFKTTLIKSFLSSPAALRATAETKLNTLKHKKAQDAETKSLDNFLRDVIHGVDQLKDFSRFQQLASFLEKNPVSNDNRLVIFTERVATMQALAEYLLKKGIVAGEFDPKINTQASGILLSTAHGGTGDVDLQKIVKGFQATRNGFQILIATNVASEGLNLHPNCYRLIHFDLPWSLITLEQRNGRIDRLGQKFRPEITYFASYAAADTKETKASELRDDFWIVEKIEKRIATAALDMDEEALSRFVNGEIEEEENTQRYEQKTLASDLQNPSDLSALFQAEPKPEEHDAVHRRALATLFEKSPTDFVLNVCEEAGIELGNAASQGMKIKLKETLALEVNRWPREFRPDDNVLHLEANASQMEMHYKERLGMNASLDRSYLNEIHPFTAVLENTALGFFKGAALPTLCIRGDEVGSLHFLVQSTLFNNCNDVVMQYWQFLSVKKASNKMQRLVDVTSPDHVHGICQWMNERLARVKRSGRLDDLTVKRIQKLSPSIIDEMKAITDECRRKRGDELRPVLRDELKRIKAWEEGRRLYLENFIKNTQSGVQRGLYGELKKAESELESMDADSKAYNEFVQNFIRTSEAADIRILGCLVTVE